MRHISQSTSLRRHPFLFWGMILLALGCTNSKPDIKKPNSNSTAKGTDAELAPMDSAKDGAKAFAEKPSVGSSSIGDDTVKRPKHTEAVVESFNKDSEPWIDALQLGTEQWELQFLRNAPVGFVQQRFLESENKDPSLMRIEMENIVWLERGGERIEQKLEVKSIEGLNGKLESLQMSMTVGGKKTELNATLAGGKLQVTRKSSGQSAVSSIQWKDHYGGPFAIEQSLRRSPISSGEKRSLAYFDPILNEVIEAELTGGKPLNTPMLDGRLVQLLEVQVELRRGDKVLRNLLWINQEGISQKTYSGAMDIRTFRCSKAVACTIRGKGLVDMMAKTSIPLTGSIADGDSAKSITFRVKMADTEQVRMTGETDPYKYFSRHTNQSIKSIDPQTAEVTVHRIDANMPTPEGIQLEKAPEDSTKSATGFFQSEEASVQQLANKFSEAESIDRPAYERWAKGVFNVITKKEFSRSIVGAGEVAMRMQGDSTDHAILLAAIARSQGIPSRLACGFVYSDGSGMPSLNYHTWTELWIDDRWLPLDAYQPQVPMPPTRLKITETEIDKDDPYSIMLGVLGTIENLEIEVVKVDR